MIRNTLLILSLFLLVANISLAQEKIVFIDINFIFKNSNVGKDLNDQIKKKDDQIESEIESFKSNIEKEKNQILSQKNVISTEEYNNKITDLENKIKEMNNLIAKKKNELNNFIEIYSTENSIDMILDKSNLLMARKDLNITQKIINLFNENVKEINIK